MQHVVMILDDEVLLPLVNTPKEKHQRGKKGVEEVDFLIVLFYTYLSQNLKSQHNIFIFQCLCCILFASESTKESDIKISNHIGQTTFVSLAVGIA